MTLELPKNKSFGTLFSIIFLIVSVYSFYLSHFYVGLIFLFLSLVFFGITIFKPKLLQPLNILWMKFGLLLSKIMNPIILGIIYFGIFTPISILMKTFNRDELKIRPLNRETYWQERNADSTDRFRFKNQF